MIAMAGWEPNVKSTRREPGVLPPRCNSWRIVTISLYTFIRIIPHVACCRVGAVRKVYRIPCDLVLYVVFSRSEGTIEIHQDHEEILDGVPCKDHMKQCTAIHGHFASCDIRAEAV